MGRSRRTCASTSTSPRTSRSVRRPRSADGNGRLLQMTWTWTLRCLTAQCLPRRQCSDIARDLPLRPARTSSTCRPPARSGLAVRRCSSRIVVYSAAEPRCRQGPQGTRSTGRPRSRPVAAPRYRFSSGSRLLARRSHSLSYSGRQVWPSWLVGLCNSARTQPREVPPCGLVARAGAHPLLLGAGARRRDAAAQSARARGRRAAVRRSGSLRGNTCPGVVARGAGRGGRARGSPSGPASSTAGTGSGSA